MTGIGQRHTPGDQGVINIGDLNANWDALALNDLVWSAGGRDRGCLVTRCNVQHDLVIELAVDGLDGAGVSVLVSPV